MYVSFHEVLFQQRIQCNVENILFYGIWVQEQSLKKKKSVIPKLLLKLNHLTFFQEAFPD